MSMIVFTVIGHNEYPAEPLRNEGRIMRRGGRPSKDKENQHRVRICEHQIVP